MERLRADVELALLHIKQVEQRVADQYGRVERLRQLGAPTDVSEDLLRTLQHSLELLKSHLARITGPAGADKVSG